VVLDEGGMAKKGCLLTGTTEAASESLLDLLINSLLEL
jgi:hypothetical protein